MKEDIFDKLVRDKIPLIIKNSGDIPIWHSIQSKEEKIHYLTRKLREETEEFLEDYSISELSDLIEVLTAFANCLNYDKTLISRERNIKCNNNGSFEQFIVLDKVIRSNDMSIFENKKDCDIYIPFKTKNDELFLVEMLEICECYLEPLKYGIAKEDIIEFVEFEKKGNSMLDFLYIKRYIADDNCFIKLAMRYMLDNRCIKLSFIDKCYTEIEQLVSEYTIDELRKCNINLFNVKNGYISDEGEFISDEE